MSGTADTDTDDKQEKEVQGVDVGKGEDQAVQLSFDVGDGGNLHLVDEEQVKRWPDKWLGLMS